MLLDERKNAGRIFKNAYPCKRGEACIVNFDLVKTKAVKLELKQPETHSCGLFEWSVK